MRAVMVLSNVLFAASLWILFTTTSLVGASLTSDQKQEILHAHNYYRGKVDPIATNMQRLVGPVHYSYIV